MLDNSIEVLTQVLRDKPYLVFSEYMEHALYHPKWGYYMQDPSPIGRDFVTAPLLSPTFAKAISIWLARENRQHVVEIGAGTGILAKQLLTNPEIKSYTIVDKNPTASSNIEDSRCRWIDSLEGINGTIIANELLDALPFRRFCLKDNGLYEFIIKGDPLEVQLMAVSMDLLPSHIRSKLHALPLPYIFEYCDYRVIFEQLKDFKGALLLVDYGYEADYFHPDRSLGTMMCYQKHHSIPFSLSQTGLMDITCAVNWPLVEVIAKEYGFKLKQIGPQSDFIQAMVGIDLNASAAKLLYEYEMGTFVKVVEFFSE